MGLRTPTATPTVRLGAQLELCGHSREDVHTNSAGNNLLCGSTSAPLLYNHAEKRALEGGNVDRNQYDFVCIKWHSLGPLQISNNKS